MVDASKIYVGLDVDDTQYHGSALDKHTSDVINFKCRLTLKDLLSELEKLSQYFPARTPTLCYEATHIGFTLSSNGQGYKRGDAPLRLR